MRYILPIAFFIFCCLWACDSETQDNSSQKSEQLNEELSKNEGGTKWVKNPNGDSELALLMRDMYDNGEILKKQISEGAEELDTELFEAIHTAKRTDNEGRPPAFISFAETYQSAVSQLGKSPIDERRLAYTNMVDACMNCHTAYCPGPKMRIKNLYLPKLAETGEE